MIETNNLGRHFGAIKAVDGVSFSVNRGEVLGFLGPNGAGKSTTMKMLTGFLTPTFGSAIVGGFNVEEQSIPVRSLIGYLPENAPLYGEMTVESFLRFIAEVRQIDAKKISEAVERVSALTSIRPVMRQRIETLSKGFRRRVGLAQSLIHDPEILILDEPTDGLDPNQKHEVRELIRSMATDKCIILSTHILEEVDEVCSRAVIIANGKMVADDTPESLRKRSTLHGSVRIVFGENQTPVSKGQLESLPGAKRVEELDLSGYSGFQVYPSDSNELLYGVVERAKQESWDVRELKLEQGHLDEVFRSITLEQEAN